MWKPRNDCWKTIKCELWKHSECWCQQDPGICQACLSVEVIDNYSLYNMHFSNILIPVKPLWIYEFKKNFISSLYTRVNVKKRAARIQITLFTHSVLLIFDDATNVTNNFPVNYSNSHFINLQLFKEVFLPDLTLLTLRITWNYVKQGQVFSVIFNIFDYLFFLLFILLLLILFNIFIWFCAIFTCKWLYFQRSEHEYTNKYSKICFYVFFIYHSKYFLR